MCGIAVIVETDRPVDSELLARMTDALTHRGPDGGDCGIYGRAGLGHRRLAIIDLSDAGRQPMSNADGSLWLTYNGEIYNYKTLRRELESLGYAFRTQSDSEVILHGYAAWGTDCAKRFNGMFAYAIWDVAQQTLVAARDHFGIKPIFYAHIDGRLLCASEIGALLIDPSIPRDLSHEALHHYLSLMNVPAPHTIYKHIFRLPPGCTLIFRDGQLTIQPYWTLDPAQPLTANDERTLIDLEEQLAMAVEAQLVADVEVGAFLSGGIDSSVVCALAARAQPQFRTFSVSFPGLPAFDESEPARLVAQHLRTQHQEIIGTASAVNDLPRMTALFAEPFAVSSVMPLYWMSREAKKYVKVVLTGDGGDEVFGGYPWRHSLLDAKIDRLPAFGGLRRGFPSAYNRWHTSYAQSVVHRLSSIPLYGREALRDWNYVQQFTILNEAEKRALYTPAWAETVRDYSTDRFLLDKMPPPSVERLARWLTFDLRTTLPDEMLMKVDRATMAWGLEARVPLLDHTLVEYAIRIPQHLKVRGNNGKLILKRLCERLVPPQIANRPKHGFNTPLDDWFRGELRPMVEDLLSEQRVKAAGIFDPGVVRQLIDWQRTRPEKGLANVVFTLLQFELWREQQTERR